MDREFVEKLYWETMNMERLSGGVFEGYYMHLNQVLLCGIREEWKKKKEMMEEAMGVPELSQELLAVFLGQMQRITLRTLLSEMELCEENRMLEGDTEQERYGFYEERFLGDPAYLRELYEAYPMMFDNMMCSLEDFIRNISEMLDRFLEDRIEINTIFFPDKPCRKIERIGGGGSDSHKHGHRVLTVELDNGEKLVYKPRCLAVDKAYGTFQKWVFDNVGMFYQQNGILDRNEYGWCQWIPAMSCHSTEEMERYYYRNGVLLGICYLLGSEDMHYENLIACGEYPVIVDLEMAVGRRGIETDKMMSGTERLYQESVLRTGLLPLYTWNRNGKGVNVGAINGRGGQLMPIVMPVVAKPGTVNMHIEYRRPQMKEGNNLAMLNGEFIEPYIFLDKIQDGFRDTYVFMVESREKYWKCWSFFKMWRFVILYEIHSSIPCCL